MDTVNEIELEFLNAEFNKAQIEISQQESGREAVDFIIESKNGKQYLLFFQFIDFETARSIKIPKQDLGELNDNLLIDLVLLIESEAKVLYLILSKDLSQSNSNIFINNEVSLMPSLSNWEIKISSKGIKQLETYTISN
jgi:hypothetical protein